MMPVPDLPAYRVPLILASRSPRRIELMRQAGFRFTAVDPGSVEESYPASLLREEIPMFLAELKSRAFLACHPPEGDTVVITADTVVWLDNRVLGKPRNRQEVLLMLAMLSGTMHRVYTGVCLASRSRKRVFFSQTEVYFGKLDKEEIIWYADHFRPFDKAGAYGIQEWIGQVAVEKIEGSYSGVMGLPMAQLYGELRHFAPV
jgi:septum formation protein